MNKVDGVYVKDSLNNAANYANYGQYFPKAIAFLQNPSLSSLPNGRYDIDGEHVFAMIQESPMKPWGTGRPELHHIYFDIQLPLSDVETIGVGRMDPAAVGMFDEAKDCGFYDDVPVEPLTLKPGEFVILHPHTCAHAPCCTQNGLKTIRKIVIKVRA